MNKTNTFILASLLTCFSNISLANCKLPDLPPIPYGALATETDIQTSKIAVQAFIADISDYRLCIKKELTAAGEPASKIAIAKWEKKHNNSVETEEYIANAFNTQLRLYKSKKAENENN